MKVLFALNNDNVSNAIIKRYQKQYKEIISYKNVYYFNAILKELQKDKTYDRVVISEDLEPFANNDYDTIDKFIFEKLDKISDEATKQNGDDIEIILICSDRINKSDNALVKFFGIGIYNAIIGNDRQIETLCDLIHHPRTKKEAKIYYKIESSNVNYQSENENSVNESEVQNILAHYKRLGKNEDKYVDSFNTIVAQYTDEQLKIIIKFLPMHVKAVLEEKSPKYQELATFSINNDNKGIINNFSKKPAKTKESIAVKMLNEESSKSKITKPIVIPSALKGKSIKNIEQNRPNEGKGIDENKTKEALNNDLSEQNVEIDEDKTEKITPVKRGRGRPKKIVEEKTEQLPRRGRGRPRKETIVEDENEEEPIENQFSSINEIEVPNVNIDSQVEIPDIKMEEPLDLFDLNEEENDEDHEEKKELDLFNMEQDEEDNDENEKEIEEDDEEEDETEENDDVIDLFNIDENEGKSSEESQETYENDNMDNNLQNSDNDDVQDDNLEKFSNEIITRNNPYSTDNTNTLMTRDVKVVCFVGTTKNGTSFIVNNLAEMFSTMHIPTAILDMTKTRNAYYIYSKNEEELRNIATQSIKKLEQGIDEGIQVNKKLSVYTALPNDDFEVRNINEIISTLAKTHSIILVDCDFTTPIECFEIAQEIYLVQTQDVLTIQPLTAFLRNLKAKNVLKKEKIKIIINKEQKIKGLTDQVLIGGMAYYNDPAMAFMTELFNKDNIMYCKIPFEMQNYAKYLSSVANCYISLNGYTKALMNSLNELAEMVYPLINKQTYSPIGNNKKKNKKSLF